MYFKCQCGWEGHEDKLLSCCSCGDDGDPEHPREYWCKGPFHMGCPICHGEVDERPQVDDGYDELARDIASEEEAWEELR